MSERALHSPPEAAPPPTPEAKEALVERRDRWTLQVARSEKISSEEDPNLHVNSGLMISGEAPVANRSQVGRLLMSVEMAPPDEVEMLTRWTLEYTPKANALAKVFISEEGRPYAVGRVRPTSPELFYAVRENGLEEPTLRPLATNENGLMSEPLEEGETLVMAGGAKGEKLAALTVENADSHPETNDEVKDTILCQNYIIKQREREIAREKLREEARKKGVEVAAGERPEDSGKEPAEPGEKVVDEATEQREREAREALDAARDKLATATASKMNRATGLFWTKKKEAAYQEARDAYDRAYLEAGRAGLNVLEEAGHIEEKNTEQNWATLYVVEQQRQFRLLTNEKRLEAADKRTAVRIFFESTGGRLATGLASGALVRWGLNAASVGTGWVASAVAGGAIGGVTGADEGRREGIREGAMRSNANIDSELAALYGRIDRTSVDSILGDDQTSPEELINRERKLISRKLARRALEGAGVGAISGIVGYELMNGLLPSDTASAAEPAKEFARPEITPPEAVEPRELSGDELLEMHADNPEAARDIVLNEGPYNAFQEMGIPESKWEELYRSEDLMQKLMENGDVYSLLESGDQSYGWGLAHAGELSDATVKDIYEAAGMQTTEVVDAGASGSENVAPAENTVTEAEAEAQAEAAADEARAEAIQGSNRDLASMGLEVSGLQLPNGAELTPAMVDHVTNIEGSGFEYNSDGALTMSGEMTPTAREEIASYLGQQGIEVTTQPPGEVVEQLTNQLTQMLGTEITELDGRFENVEIRPERWEEVSKFITDTPRYADQFEIGANGIEGVRNGASESVIQDLVDDLRKPEIDYVRVIS